MAALVKREEHPEELTSMKPPMLNVNVHMPKIELQDRDAMCYRNPGYMPKISVFVTTCLVGFAIFPIRFLNTFRRGGR